MVGKGLAVGAVLLGVMSCATFGRALYFQHRVVWEIEVTGLPVNVVDVAVTMHTKDGYNILMEQVTSSLFRAHSIDNVHFTILYTTSAEIGDSFMSTITTTWHVYCGPVHVLRKDDVIDEYPVRLKTASDQTDETDKDKCSYHTR